MQEYIKQSKDFFNDAHHGMSITNHSEHNHHSDYWNILLADPKNNPEKWKNKNALDFGCGCGRNILNLIKLCEWKNVDGCDICLRNAEFSKKYVTDNKKSNANTTTWENDGVSINSMDGYLPNKKYDFIMSTIVFEHIAPYSVRRSILESIYENLEIGGLFSLSLSNLTSGVDYYNEKFLFPGNTKINNHAAIEKDFDDIGYKNINIITGDTFQNRDWSYITGSKL